MTADRDLLKEVTKELWSTVKKNVAVWLNLETRPKIVQFLTLSEISKVLKRLRTRAEIQTITGEDTISAFEDETLEGLPEADPEDGEPADTEANDTETGESPATETEEPTE